MLKAYSGRHCCDVQYPKSGLLRTDNTKFCSLRFWKLVSHIWATPAQGKERPVVEQILFTRAGRFILYPFLNPEPAKIHHIRWKTIHAQILAIHLHTRKSSDHWNISLAASGISLRSLYLGFWQTPITMLQKSIGYKKLGGNANEIQTKAWICFFIPSDRIKFNHRIIFF